jgi:hypothetical protein
MLKILIPLILIVLVWLSVHKLRVLKSAGRIPALSSEELTALFDRPSNIHLFLKAAEELKRRQQNIDFVLPHFIDMVMANNTTACQIGWSGLKQFFRDQLPGVDFSPLMPTAEIRIRLKEIKETLPAGKG